MSQQQQCVNVNECKLNQKTDIDQYQLNNEPDPNDIRDIIGVLGF
jgi:hypothetical protein